MASVTAARGAPLAAFLLERVRAARGAQWDEGRGRVQPPAPPSGPALRTFAERRVRGVPEDVVRGLFAWIAANDRSICCSRSRRRGACSPSRRARGDASA